MKSISSILEFLFLRYKVQDAIYLNIPLNYLMKFIDYKQITTRLPYHQHTAGG